MGRKPTKYLNLPARMRAREQKSGTIYYYYDAGGKPRKEIPLGSDYVEAVRKWTALEADGSAPDLLTFAYVAERYKREVIPTKAARTQKDNAAELAKLLEFFDDPPAPLDSIEPVHIRQYLDWRKSAKVRANREKALFSHIWNHARNWGYTALPNPCAGIKGYSETGRSIYVDDAVYEAIWKAANQPLRDAMDMAYLTGQRPADVLKLAETDIKDGVLCLRQGKTGLPLRIAIEGLLAQVMERIKAQKAKLTVRSLALICNEHGQPFSYSAMDNRWEHARARAAKEARKKGHEDLAREIMRAQFRDLRAKAGTDKEMAEGMEAAQAQLGHADASMTRHYVRHRAGKLVKPTK